MSEKCRHEHTSETHVPDSTRMESDFVDVTLDGVPVKGNVEVHDVEIKCKDCGHTRIATTETRPSSI